MGKKEEYEKPMVKVLTFECDTPLLQTSKGAPESSPW